MTADDDRGYMIEGYLCQNTYSIFWVEATMNTTLTVTDQAGCAQPSVMKLYAVEKHGYTLPINIPWPPP
jgi:hypothetical protein